MNINENSSLNRTSSNASRITVLSNNTNSNKILPNKFKLIHSLRYKTILFLLNLTKFFIKLDTKHINFFSFLKMILGSKIFDIN